MELKCWLAIHSSTAPVPLRMNLVQRSFPWRRPKTLMQSYWRHPMIAFVKDHWRILPNFAEKTTESRFLLMSGWFIPKAKLKRRGFPIAGCRITIRKNQGSHFNGNEGKYRDAGVF